MCPIALPRTCDVDQPRNLLMLMSYDEDSCIVSLDAKDYRFTYETGELEEVVRA